MSSWEDTVIKAGNIQDLDIPCETCHREPFWKSGEGTVECMECIALKHREAQAEITWDIAERQGFERARDEMNLQTMSLAELLSDRRREGRKDVVGWIEGERLNQNPSVWYSRWQAKLKEWGL